ncbi:MAG: hypothetical protein MK135_13100 [Polyangiaceae bacterium]|nr:hypothetical protein [Polyangiaceae bacterium]
MKRSVLLLGEGGELSFTILSRMALTDFVKPPGEISSKSHSGASDSHGEPRVSDGETESDLCLTALIQSGNLQSWTSFLSEKGQKGDTFQKVNFLEAQPDGIDLGLGGEDYLRLAARVDLIVLCPEPSFGVTRKGSRFASLVRMADECVELYRAACQSDGQREIQVLALSSLMVFGSYAEAIAEADFQVGQRFGHAIEEDWAIFEKILRQGIPQDQLTLLRTAPIQGDDQRLYVDSPLQRFASRMVVRGKGMPLQGSGALVHFETSTRVAEVLNRLAHQFVSGCYHLVDNVPFTDESLLEWLSERLEVHLEESRPGRGRALSTWWITPAEQITFADPRASSRQGAEELFSDLLDPDYEDLLATWFPLQKSLT